ncbi:16S rRNA (cytidine(1402)-2'-O)-methyltransferase [Nitrosospira briensis]|uniref:16S rRNA (cytidine(1402)-2'-O)-methyltransferase n=1 Tax=Nitrosospira briensis TaxID=35799 RepID=UPI00210BDA42|nr:16S rRNA (cytidine(1402)-2'-O)-methyltransferase [Nitrosospira briensis]
MNQTVIQPGTLYVIATPIGNLRDITLRALDVLAAVDVIAAEDTRTTAHLLRHYSITGKMMSLHQHNESSTAMKIVNLLSRGEAVALVTDAGTPGISDPGAILVKQVREHGYKTMPIPGANAAACALSIAGMPTPHFLFYGFLPATAGLRRRDLENLKSYPYTLIFYEAPHRILDSIEDLVEVLGAKRQITIARELTKLFESIHACALGEATAWLKADPNRQKGEFVLLISGAPARPQGELSEQGQRTLALLLRDMPLKQAVRLAAEISGESKNTLYSLALSLQGGPNQKE